MTDIKEQVERWLKDVVVGLQLCPFAKAPLQKKQIRFVVSHAQKEEELNEALIEECRHLDSDDTTETTLLICPTLFDDFFDFCQFLPWAQTTLKNHHWEGIYQLAHFHPHYCFSGCDPDDPQNLTNRSPYPILHLIREDSMEKVLSRFDEPENIPEKNIETMNGLSETDIKRYFYYLR